jgi:hypothetical protein
LKYNIVIFTNQTPWGFSMKHLFERHDVLCSVLNHSDAGVYLKTKSYIIDYVIIDDCEPRGDGHPTSSLIDEVPTPIHVLRIGTPTWFSN